MTARTLLQFLLVGALLFGARYAIGKRSTEAEAELVVAVAADASEAERERATDEALLLELALRSGWARTDPVVRDRLARNLRFADAALPQDAAGDEAALVERAVALGMHRSDGVVRARLLGRAREALIARGRIEPSDAELRRFTSEHAERYQVATSVSFTHIFLSAERRGAALDADARALAKALAHKPPAATAAHRLSDPLLHPKAVKAASVRRLDALFGAGFGAELARAPLRRWTGPVRSSYGVHFVWIDERGAARLPPLASLRKRVLRDWHDAQRKRLLREQLDRLRARHAIRIARRP